MQRFEMQETRSEMRASRFERTTRAMVLTATTASILVLAGCRQDMQDEPKFFPQRGTTFYADGRSVRPQVANTVARNQGDEGSYFYTGLVNGKEGDGLPIDLTADTMARGQERFNIYCTPCHSRVGNGDGMIVQRGYRPAGDFHTARLRNAPLGHFFAVITNGYGAMPDYAAQITPQDRWAIAAYIRALQLSQNAKESDVPAGQHVEDLHQIANEQGMPPGFADPWGMPGTAIYGTPNGQDNGIPGLGTTTAPAGAQSHGSNAAGQPSPTRNSSGPPLAKPDAGAPGKLAGPQH
jgi:mono/diheme cytochrome c family protein